MVRSSPGSGLGGVDLDVRGDAAVVLGRKDVGHNAVAYTAGIRATGGSSRSPMGRVPNLNDAIRIGAESHFYVARGAASAKLQFLLATEHELDWPARRLGDA